MKNNPNSLEWLISSSLVPYPDAVAAMERRVKDIAAGSAPELVWLLEHPPLYTAGTSARQADLLGNCQLPVFDAGRGGQYTYHGPGQRIGYVLLDLKRRAAPSLPDLRRFVKQLEQWLMDTLARLGVDSFTREGRIGVWVHDRHGREAKIGALGIRVRQGVSYHGISLNIRPDLSHYRGIVPCGIHQYGVTSLAALGKEATMQDVDQAMKHSFERIFTRG